MKTLIPVCKPPILLLAAPELLVLFRVKSGSSPEMLEDVECDHLLTLKLVFGFLLSVLSGRPRTSCRELFSECSTRDIESGLVDLPRKIEVRGPALDDNDPAFLNVTDDEVEFDLDGLLVNGTEGLSGFMMAAMTIQDT